MGIADAATLALVGGAHSAVQIFGYLAEQKRNVAALIGGWYWIKKKKKEKSYRF